MTIFELLRPIAFLSLAGEFGIYIFNINDGWVEWCFEGTGKPEPIHESLLKEEVDNEGNIYSYFTNDDRDSRGQYYLYEFSTTSSLVHILTK